MFIIVAALCLFSFTVAWSIQEGRHRISQDLRDYQEVRDRVGDMGLSRDVHQLQRRIAGLLSSPQLYLRARRVVGPLDLQRDDLTAELELLETVTT